MQACRAIAVIIIFFFPLAAKSQKSAWALELGTDTLRQADLYAEHYQWKKALPLYREAEKQFLEDGDLDHGELARLGRIRASVKEYSLRQIYEALNKESGRSPAKKNPALRLRALFLKADIESDTDALCALASNASQRRKDWQEVLAFSQKTGNKHLEDRARGELGLVKLLSGDPSGADEVFTALWHASETGEKMNEMRFRTIIAALYSSAGKNQEALSHLDRAIAMTKSDQNFTYFPALFEKALILIASNRIQKAMPYVEQCIAQAKRTGALAQNAQALYLQGHLHFAKGRISEATDLLQQAFNLSQNLSYHRLVSKISLDLSQIHRARNELRQGIDYAEMGLHACLKSGDPMETILHLRNKAAIRVDQCRISEAGSLYKEVLQKAEALLKKYPAIHNRASLIARMSSFYTEYFSFTLHQLHDPAKAFMILEQARGRSISDSIRRRRLNRSTAEDEDQLPPNKYELLLARLQARLWKKNDSQELHHIRSEIFDLEQQLASSRITNQRNIKALDFSPIPLSEIQKSLYPAEVMLEYVLDNPSSTCLVISQSGIQSVTFGSRNVIEETVANYRKNIQQNRKGDPFAQNLYSLLLSSIPDIDRKERITIIPDGLLNLLPFDALMAPSGQILLESHRIDYSPSATITHLLRKNPSMRPGKRRLLGVGDVQYPALGKSGSAYFSNRQLPARLEGSFMELSSIAKAMKDVTETIILRGESVSESVLKSLNLGNFDILHFAVHGISDQKFTDRSALLLGPQIDDRDDGIFQASEIIRHPLKADLVVLSACDTAMGKVLEQEGVSNLVKSFLIAGARSVVASIWPAEDRSTAELMACFYSYLAQGMDKGSALRQAKLDFIRKYKDNALPKHWAGMLMIGDGSDSLYIESLPTDAKEKSRR